MAANWKMHKTAAETRKFFLEFSPAVAGLEGRDLVIAPPFTSIPAASEALAETGAVSLAAQNMYCMAQGAYTGEIAPAMLKEFGVRWVILGHSERRHILGESDGLIARKVEHALESDLTPILCIGETLREREAGRTLEIIDGQLSAGLAHVTAEQGGRTVLAYEPVWAIGTGKTATADQAQEVHGHIRSWLAGRFDPAIAGEIRILYGGSVNPANVDDLMALPDVDGALVGGASLSPESFSRLARFKVR